MSRTRTTLTVIGAAAAAGAAGYAFGALFAPASGKELRRRLAWTSEEQWRAFTRASERFLAEATARAKAEIERARAYAPAGSGR
jgi:gas vesicle protein